MEITTPLNATKDEFVVALARGLQVIRAFSAGKPELTLSEVAARSGLNPATARRLLLTLTHLGYVGRNGTRFLLRPRILELGAAFLGSMNLQEVAQPYLLDLRDQTGDSSSLTVLDGHDIIHVSHVSTRRLMRVFVTSGTRVPAYVSATGRVLLAHQPEPELEDYLQTAELKPLTDKTVTSPDELRIILSQVRRDGYAIVVDQLDYGVCAIGVPVADARGRMVGGVSVVVNPGYGTDDDLVRTRLPALQEAATNISRELHRFPWLAHSVAAQSQS